jgi:hypothetical protein
VFLLVFSISFVALMALIDFWSNWRRYGGRIARRLVVVIASQGIIIFAILVVPWLFGSLPGSMILALGAWVFVLLLGAQIVILIWHQPNIDEASLDLGNGHSGMGQAVVFVFYALYLLYMYLSIEEAPSYALPMIGICILAAVYFAARSVRNYYVTNDGIWTPTSKIKWEQVTAWEFDTAPDGALILYVQADGGLPWRNRFASKVPAQAKAALVEYIERHTSLAQAIRA